MRPTQSLEPFVRRVNQQWWMLLLAASFVTAPASASPEVPPPLPLMPIPTARQLEWQRQELIMFVHFTVNTFTDREWGDGSEKPQIFNPTELDVTQWVDVAQEIGFKTIILRETAVPAGYNLRETAVPAVFAAVVNQGVKQPSRLCLRWWESRLCGVGIWGGGESQAGGLLYLITGRRPVSHACFTLVKG